MKALSAFAALVCAFACADPIRERSVDELGGEDPRTPVGPLHRPGQPCLFCHGGEGPAESEFSFAGTVFQHPVALAPLRGARIRFIDGAGAEYAVTSNCAGNFYVGSSNFEPSWPVWTKVEFGTNTAEMVSPTFREGSCGACHADPATPRTAGHIYLADETVPLEQEGCR